MEIFASLMLIGVMIFIAYHFLKESIEDFQHKVDMRLSSLEFNQKKDSEFILVLETMMNNHNEFIIKFDKRLEVIEKEVNSTIEKQAGLVQDFYGWQSESKEELRKMINYYRNNLILKERELDKVIEETKNRLPK
jgi:hypothetical protein